ncbi:Translocation protein S62 [Coemansia sp. RSA 1836]|nr:Translocation protein S62 [Coemansia sp. RSA 1836]
MAAAPQGLWIFPNLFEDVGFFESFVPLYGWEVPKDARPAPGGAPLAPPPASTTVASDQKKTE